MTEGQDTILERIEAELLRPGGYFATTDEEILGERMRVFTQRAGSMRELFERSAAFGDKEYVVFGPRRFTYAEHARQVRLLARELRERWGVQPGDRVGILAANCPEWVLTFWAATATGALPVGLNGWWAGPEIAAALEDVRPRVLVGDTKRLDRLPARPDGCRVVHVDEIAALVAAPGDAELPAARIAEDDPAAILFSSGTTGRAKGIVASHRGIIALAGVQVLHGARASMLESALGVPPGPADGAGLVSTPLFHVSGLYAGVVTRLAVGARTVWTTGRFDAGEVLALIERERVTGWGPTGTMMRRVLEHPDLERYDRSSMRYLGLGGSPIAPELMKQVREAFPNARVASAVGYGQTECGALATIAFGEDLTRFPGTVGRPLPTIDVEIRDDSGDTVADGEVGEVCVRSPLVMLGYWERPEASATRFWPGRWLRTGDVGHMRGGRLWIDARRDDLILRGGENIYPAEIEHTLERWPGVAESVVYGRDDDELGQVPVAVVVPELQATVDPTALRAWVSEQLAYFKVPVEIIVQREALPRNATGKVLRFAVREAREGSPRG